MNDVFISYKREDEARVARLVLALEKSDLSVWWDRGLPGGEQWRANIEAALMGARCVVVVWTQASVGPAGGFVRDEASRGSARQILVPVLFDKVQPPLGFGEVQAIDLVGWRGSIRDPFFKDAAAAIRAKITGQPVPHPQGPMRMLLRRLTIGSLASALAVAGGAFATNTFSLQNRICHAPMGQPWLSDACGSVGLGASPTRDERLAWERRTPGECNALRAHLRAFPDGVYRAKADSLLSARTVTAVETLVPGQRLLTLFVGTDARPFPSDDAAKAAAMRRGRDDAERMCKDFATTGLFNYRAADVQAERWNCVRADGGRVCSLEGRAVCNLDERKITESERCEEKPHRINHSAAP